MPILRTVRLSSWFYILGYESLRGFYVLVLMPLAGGTFGSVVGLMICTFLLLVAATVLLLKRPGVAFVLLLVYLIAVSVVWYCFELPSIRDYMHDRILDLLLVPAFYGATSTTASVSSKLEPNR